MHSCVIATMKNEGPHLLEWVAWQRLLGFDEIIIAQNDSDDLTLEMLICLHAIGVITFIENSDQHEKAFHPQGRAYFRAAGTEAYKRSDWAIALDVDEFLQITTGQGRVADLVTAVGPNVDQIHVHWQHMGSDGLKVFEDDLTTSRFTQTADLDKIVKYAACFKTMFRTEAFDAPSVHRPVPTVLDTTRAVTASGVRLSGPDIGKAASIDPGGYRFARLHHFRIKDPQTFIINRLRGRPKDADNLFENLGYWASGDARATTDLSLQKERDSILAEISALDVLSNGRLSRLHKEAVALWHDRVAAFMATSNWRAYYETVCDLQDELRSPQEHAALTRLFEAGELSWKPGGGS